MKDPAHPPGPEFGKASDTAEGQRQHMIAALDDRQRDAFQMLKDQQAGKRQELQKAQEGVRDEQIAQRTQRHLLQDKELRLDHDAHKHKLKRPQDLSRAVEDFMAGRDTPVTREYNCQLSNACGRAKQDVDNQNNQARQRRQEAQQREQDRFLRKATRQRATPEFTMAAKDTSWSRAFNRAAEQEVDRENEHDINRGLDEPRTR